MQYILQTNQISANICDFDKPTITRRKSLFCIKFPLRCTHKAYSSIRDISSSEAHIFVVYVPWRLNGMKPVELEGQNQGKTKLLLSFYFIFVQKWKKLPFSWHLFCHILWIWPYFVILAVMPWMFNPKSVANLLLVWDRAVL